MKPGDLLRELAYPLTDLSVLLAIIVFWLLGSLASAAGLLGLWLGFIILPAFFRYALYILEARANGHDAPAVGIELFNWVENFWSLFPLVLLCGYVWTAIYVASHFSTLAALFLGMLLLLFIPASMAVLAVTRSPLQSLNPGAVAKMIQATGWDYAIILLTLALVSLAIVFVASRILPAFVMNFLGIYAYFLMHSLTGAVVGSKGIAADVSIPDAIELSDDEQRTRHVSDRQNIATHAYGFISRGNREGGLAHIQSFIDGEQDPEEARNWFFNEMLKWENTDTALFFAQRNLHRLLLGQRDTEALKLMSQCYHANSKFRPLAEDRDSAIELATRWRRQDLLELLN